MDRTIRIDGDRWKVRLSQEPPSPGVRALVFFPTTSDQRPYRVVEVSQERVDTIEDLERLSERELEEFYRKASSMDYPHGYD